MPDHIHWLLQLTGGSPLSQMVWFYKAKVSHTMGTKVWQKGFHDRAIRKEEDIRDVARYIVGNPLRKNLVQDIGDYPYWDAVWLEEGKEKAGSSML